MDRKNTANKVLSGVFLLFILASVLKYFYKDLIAVQLFSFITEAAVVGGVADWFAVTALFRKPLGFPWHTALITRHRGRVIGAMADMIENELLTIQSIKQRVDKICFVSLLIDWVEHRDGKLLLKKLFINHSIDILAGIDAKAASLYLDDMLKNRVREMNLSPYVKRAIQWAVKHKQYEQLIICIIDECISMIQSSGTKKLIYQQLLKIKEKQTRSIFEKAVFWLGEQTDSINLSEAADAVYEELLITLHAAKQTDHTLYKWVHDKLLAMAEQLESQGSWSEVLENWKHAVAEEMDTTQLAGDFVQIALEAARDSSNSPILRWLDDQMQMYWDNFIENEQAQIWLETGIKQAVYKLIENEHRLIGIIVKNVLNTFSDEDLNQFIEDKAGDDLQWIRINGCVVGGFVGLGLFVFLHVIYEPFVVAAVQEIFK